jgi:hypothetical protein
VFRPDTVLELEVNELLLYASGVGWWSTGASGTRTVAVVMRT